MYCTCFHQRLQYASSVLNTPLGRDVFGRRSNSVFGVRGCGSLESSLVWVIGRSFKIFSTSAMKVRSASSESNCCFNNAPKIVFVERIIRSHRPSMWLECESLTRLSKGAPKKRRHLVNSFYICVFKLKCNNSRGILDNV